MQAGLFTESPGLLRPLHCGTRASTAAVELSPPDARHRRAVRVDTRPPFRERRRIKSRSTTGTLVCRPRLSGGLGSDWPGSPARTARAAPLTPNEFVLRNSTRSVPPRLLTEHGRCGDDFFGGGGGIPGMHTSPGRIGAERPWVRGPRSRQKSQCGSVSDGWDPARGFSGQFRTDASASPGSKERSRARSRRRRKPWIRGHG